MSKTKPKPVLAAAVLVTVFLVVVGCARQQATQTRPVEAKPSPAKTTPGDLFVVTAGSGTAAKVNPDVVELVLADVAPSVTRFADRPSRQASTEPVADLARRWGSLFGDVPPNAALVTRSESGADQIATVLLEAPSYDSSSKSLSFKAKLLPRESMPIPDIPVSFGRAELFIDPSGGTPSPGQPQFQIPQWPSNSVRVTFENIPAQNFTGVEISDMGGYGGWILQTVSYGGGNPTNLPVGNIAVARNALLIYPSSNVDSLTFEMLSCSYSGTIKVTSQNLPSGATITLDAGAGTLTIKQPGTYGLNIANAQDCVKNV